VHLSGLLNAGCHTAKQIGYIGISYGQVAQPGSSLAVGTATRKRDKQRLASGQRGDNLPNTAFAGLWPTADGEPALLG
jgi:hypothetical protein